MARTPFDIMLNMTAKQIRSEFSRLRRQAVKNRKEIRESEFGESQLYRKYNDVLRGAGNARKGELAHRLADLERLLERKTSTLEGLQELRRKHVEELHRSDYKFVTEENWVDFARFMDLAQDYYNTSRYDSDRSAELFGTLEENRVTPEQMQADFEFWIEHAESAQVINRGKRESYKKFKKRVAAYGS